SSTRRTNGPENYPGAVRLWAGSEDVEVYRHLHYVTITFAAADLLGDRQQRSALLLAPHAGLPRMAVHRRRHRRASPPVRRARCDLVRHHDKVPRRWTRPLEHRRAELAPVPTGGRGPHAHFSVTRPTTAR